jgi:hypothetical protein
MCSAPKPKTPEPVNPYEGMSTDPRFSAAAAKLGIEVDSEDAVRRVNQVIAEEDYAIAERDPNFNPARQQLLDEGLLSKDDDRFSSWYLSKIQGRMYDNTQDEAYAQQSADTDKAAQDFKDMMAAQSEEQAKMMEDMMNAPTYSARQAPLAPVMAPTVTPEPIPVAPPTPRMEIQKTPPAPELTSSPNNMTIVKQSASSRSRQRMRSRGTASLSA